MPSDRDGSSRRGWGVVPRQMGTGGRVRLLGISKRGDTYLRTLLIHGARAALLNSKSPPAWATTLAKERGNRRAGKQDGTDDLGFVGSRTKL